jgi:hypothetical protein
VKTQVLEWLNNGCDFNKGIALLEKHSNNTFLIRLIKINPVKNAKMLKDSLCKIANVEAPAHTSTGAPPTSGNFPKVDTFRSEFPFLNRPDCPIELKALVTDKFTSFYTYRDLHRSLRDCTNLTECAQTAKALVENFAENRAIWAELEYYKKHKVLLGKHPIFKHYQRVKDLRKLSVKDLVLKQIDLKHNVWRIQSEIAKGDKPHLDAERQQRLEIKENELSEVNRLLGE